LGLRVEGLGVKVYGGTPLGCGPGKSTQRSEASPHEDEEEDDEEEEDEDEEDEEERRTRRTRGFICE